MSVQLDDMDADSLRCFDAAATTLRFRAAAARVHLSPTAFSDRIRRLEEELGVSLLRRTTRAVALTEAGQRLLPVAREALAPLAARRPERTLHLYNADTPDLLRRLERGDLDAVVASMRLTSPRLAYASLHPEEYDLVAVERRLRRPEDARHLTLVDVSADLPLFRYFLDALADAEPWPFARVEHMGGIGNIRRRLMDGGGRVAVLPRYFIARDLAAGHLVRLMPRVRLRSDSFRLVWRAGHPREAELMALAAELRALPLR